LRSRKRGYETGLKKKKNAAPEGATARIKGKREGPSGGKVKTRGKIIIIRGKEK